MVELPGRDAAGSGSRGIESRAIGSRSPASCLRLQGARARGGHQGLEPGNLGLEQPAAPVGEHIVPAPSSGPLGVSLGRRSPFGALYPVPGQQPLQGGIIGTQLLSGLTSGQYTLVYALQNSSKTDFEASLIRYPWSTDSMALFPSPLNAFNIFGQSRE